MNYKSLEETVSWLSVPSDPSIIDKRMRIRVSRNLRDMMQLGPSALTRRYKAKNRSITAGCEKKPNVLKILPIFFRDLFWISPNLTPQVVNITAKERLTQKDHFSIVWRTWLCSECRRNAPKVEMTWNDLIQHPLKGCFLPFKNIQDTWMLKIIQLYEHGPHCICGDVGCCWMLLDDS